MTICLDCVSGRNKILSGDCHLLFFMIITRTRVQRLLIFWFNLPSNPIPNEKRNRRISPGKVSISLKPAGSCWLLFNGSVMQCSAVRDTAEGLLDSLGEHAVSPHPHLLPLTSQTTAVILFSPTSPVFISGRGTVSHWGLWHLSHH